MDSRRKLSICVVTQQLSNVFSGPGLHANNLINHLVADGHNVTVVAPKSQRYKGELPYRYISAINPLFGNNHARWFSLSISFGLIIRKLTKIEHFDIIHFTDARESLFCPMHLPIVGNVNDTYSAEIKNIGYYRGKYKDWLVRWIYYIVVHQIEKYHLPRLKSLIANSIYTSQTIIDKYHVTRDKIIVIYKSIDSKYYQAEKGKKYPGSSLRRNIIFVGGNMQRKGIMTLIEAAPLITKRVPDCQFKIVGRDPVIPIAKKLVQKKQMANHFHFLGHQTKSALRELYQTSDLFVMPSFSEAFGVVFLEAMAAGIPVIGSNVGGIPEIIKHGENGFLVPPGNPQELAKAAILVLQNQRIQERFRKAGLKTAIHYSIKKMMKETYRVYSNIITIG